MEAGSYDGLGDALLNAWLDSLLTGLEKFLETSGASAAASGSGIVLSPYRTLLVDNSDRLRRVSLQLAAAACPQEPRRYSHDSSSTCTSDFGEDKSGIDSMRPAIGFNRLASGRTEMQNRHVMRFLEADVLHAPAPKLWLGNLCNALRDTVRSRKSILSAVQRISFFAMLYALVVTPLIVCFRRKPAPYASLAEALCELILIANVIAPFSCGLPDADTQEWVTSSRAILWAYARGWLAIDIIAAVPWHIMWLMADEEAILRLSLLRLVLLPKLISQFIFGDFSIFSNSVLSRVHPNLSRVAKLISFFFLVVHLIACGYSSVGSSSSSRWSSYADDQPSLISQWTSAYYWALCGVLGENMEPTGYAETVYNCTAIVAGVLLNSCIAGSVTAVLSSLDERASRQKAKLDAINTFLNKNGVAREVCEQVQQYYKYVQASVSSHVAGDMFDDLSVSLRLKISLSLHKRFIKRCHLFARCPSDCVVALVSVLNQNWVILVPAELLFKKGAPGDGMYFVSKGEVLLYDPGTVRDESSIDLDILRRLNGQCVEGGAFLIEECKSGDFFGEKALLEERSSREASATALTFSELMFLPRAEFDSVTAKYPGFVHHLRSHNRRRTSASSTTSFLPEGSSQKTKLVAMLSRRFKPQSEEPGDESGTPTGGQQSLEDTVTPTGMTSDEREPQALGHEAADDSDVASPIERLRALSKHSILSEPPLPPGQPVPLHH